MQHSRPKKHGKSPRKKLCPEREEFGRILSTSPPIVESIFKHLSAKDLSRSARVCTLWQSMATTEKKRRKNVQWFCKVGLVDDCILPTHVASSSITTTGPDFGCELEAELNRNRAEPSLCMAFASTQFLEHFETLFPDISIDLPPEASKARALERIRARHYLQTVINASVKPHLPVRCPLTFIIAPGIVGSCPDRRPIEVEDGPALTGLFLPKVPGLEVYHFPYIPSHPRRAVEVNDLLPVEARVKCLLVFLTSRGMSYVNKVVQSVLVREKCRLAVGGAIVERTESLSGSIIALCGESVEAASVIVGPQDRKEEIKAKLEKFKEAGLLQNQCFAYMFACVGRGYHMYREHNVESNMFHSLYPRVPLVGVFGNGEMGITYLPHMPTVHRIVQLGRFKRTLKKYLHSYTTIFVMVSIKT